MGIFDKFFAGYNSDDATIVPFIQPSTRPRLFRVVFKENVWRLVPLNLLYLVFCIPLIVWCVLYIAQIETIVISGSETFLQDLLGTLYMLVLGAIPYILIMGPANAGIAYVARNVARDDVFTIWQDFWCGLKNNWKQAFLTSFISSVLPLIVYYYVAFLSTNPNQRSVSTLPAVICVIVVVFWMMASPTIYMMMVTYDLKFKALLKNTVIMTITHLPTAVGIGLLRLIPAAVATVIILYFSTPVGIILLSIYYSVSLLFFAAAEC